MTIKEFKDKSIPELDFEIQKEKHLLVQCFFHKSELASQLIGIEKQATEIKNAFKVLKTGANSTFNVQGLAASALHKTCSFSQSGKKPASLT